MSLWSQALYSGYDLGRGFLVIDKLLPQQVLKVLGQIQLEDHLQLQPLVQIRTLLAAKSQDGDDLNLLNVKWVTEV